MMTYNDRYFWCWINDKWEVCSTTDTPPFTEDNNSFFRAGDDYVSWLDPSQIGPEVLPPPEPKA
jgi:hypothetical protein